MEAITYHVEIGQVWYIKYHNASTIVKVHVESVSPKTELLWYVEDKFARPARYLKSDITWIELIPKDIVGSISGEAGLFK